jgi:mannose-6-phosphate isomerase-like protein (cupin superfamily)
MREERARTHDFTPAARFHRPGSALPAVCAIIRCMAKDYDIHTDDKFGSLALIDIGAEAAAHEPWFNQTLTTVNDSVVRLGVLEGDFHWHKHDADDEFFLVLEGELVIEIEGSDTVRLTPHQGFTVPRGVMHKTSAPVRTTLVMVEPAGVVPTGD